MKNLQAKQKWIAGIAAVSLLLSSTTMGAFAADAGTLLPDPLKNPGYIIIHNNVILPDTVEFKGVKKGDTVKVYATQQVQKLDATGKPQKDEKGNVLLVDSPGDLLGSALAKNPGSATVALKNGFTSDKIWVSLTNDGKHESSKVLVDIPEEEKTYLADQKDAATGEVTAEGIFKGHILEDGILKLDTPEKTDNRDAYFAVQNNAGLPDTITVKNPAKEHPNWSAIPEKTGVTLYSKSTADGKDTYTALGKGTVKKDGTLTISLKDGLLPSGGGDFYLGLAEFNKHESDEKIKITVEKEEDSEKPTDGDIVITNNVGKPEEVTVMGTGADGNILTEADGATPRVLAKDVFKVYNSVPNTTTPSTVLLLGQASAKKGGENVLIKLKEDLPQGASVYVTCTSYGKKESEAVTVTVGSDLGQKDFGVSSTNSDKYFEIQDLTQGDTVLIKNPSAEDPALQIIEEKTAVIVYEQGTDKDGQPAYLELGRGIVGKGGTGSIKLKKDLPEVSASGTGTVYITLTAPNHQPSRYIEVCYDGEKTSASLTTSSVVVITKNADKPASDELEITDGLIKAKDLIKVYKAVIKTDGSGDYEDFNGSETLLGTATAKVDEKSGLIKLSTALKEGDAIYVSLTTPGKKASETLIEIKAGNPNITIHGPNKTPEVDSSFFEVINYYQVADMVKVKPFGGKKIADKTIVAIYEGNAEDAALLGKATVKNGEATITLSKDLEVLLKAAANSDDVKIYARLQGVNATPSNLIELNIGNELKPSPKIESNKISFSVLGGITVDKLAARDVIKVYQAEKQVDGNGTISFAKTETLLGTGTAKKDGESVSAKLKEALGLGDAVFVTLTQYGRPESEATEFSITGPGYTSTQIDPGNVTVINNADIADEIIVKGLADKALVKVYDKKASNQALASATAKKGEVSIKLSPGLGYVDENSKIFLTLTEYNKLESEKTGIKIPEENKSTESKGLLVNITDNISIPDTVEVLGFRVGETSEVLGLLAKDTIKVYSNKKATAIIDNKPVEELVEIAGDLLGSATVKKDGDQVLIKLNKQLTAGDKLWIGLTRYGHPESTKVQFEIKANDALKSNKTKLDNVPVLVNNYASMTDTVVVQGLSDKDTITVYSAQTYGLELGKASAKKDGTLTIPIKDGLPKDGGFVYLSLTEDNKLETADRREMAVKPEGQSGTLTDGILVINNLTKADEVHVSGLAEKDIIKVYADAKKLELLGTAIVKKDGIALVKLGKQISGEKVYVTLTEYGKAEGEAAEAKVPSEDTSREFTAKVIIYNNYGVPDLVEVSGLEAKDRIVLYDAATGGSKLGEGTAKKDGTVLIPVKELPEVKADGEKSIYLELLEDNKKAKERKSYPIPLEGGSGQLNENNVVVLNNVDLAHQVLVSGLFTKDTVKVYASKVDEKGASTADESKLLGTGTAKKLGEALTITLNKDANAIFDEAHRKLKESDIQEKTYIYLSLTNYGKKESILTEKAISAKGVSEPIAENQAIVVNNVKPKADMVKIYGLNDQDVITVLNKSGEEIGKATAKKGEALITLKNQLEENIVKVARAEYNKLPAAPVEIDVPLEGTTLLPNQKKTDKPAAKELKATRTSSSKEGEVYIEFMKNLPAGAVVQAYVTSTSEKPLEPGGNQDGIWKFKGHSGSSVWITVTEEGKFESSRVKATVETNNEIQPFAFGAGVQSPKATTGSQKSASPSSSGASKDTGSKLPKSKKLTSRYISALSGGEFYINGLSQGAIITAYDKNGNFLTEDIASKSGEAWIYIGANHYEKYVWLTVTDPGKAESDSLKVTLK